MMKPIAAVNDGFDTASQTTGRGGDRGDDVLSSGFQILRIAADARDWDHHNSFQRKELEMRALGFEPRTYGLKVRCSTD
jgi:hypothetical protein